MGHLLYQLSHRAPQEMFFTWKTEVADFSIKIRDNSFFVNFLGYIFKFDNNKSMDKGWKCISDFSSTLSVTKLVNGPLSLFQKSTTVRRSSTKHIFIVINIRFFRYTVTSTNTFSLFLKHSQHIKWVKHIIMTKCWTFYFRLVLTVWLVCWHVCFSPNWGKNESDP